ncbi:Replicase [Grapevine virus J]|uniref:Replicase n=1 Tax=Grapevine virus J TaxID=2093496 RepID=A0A2P1BXW9_9VIRU|nr:Replicase [Grapevine virus J]AVI69646.1 Replicase [Grapevine virus J]
MSISVSSQRMAAAALYNNGDKDTVDQIKKLKTAGLLHSEEEDDGLFDYYVDDDVRDILGSKGINFSIHSYRNHPHPVSKMLENHILYKLAPNYLREHVLIISCKESKVKMLLLKNKKMNKNVDSYNRLVHAKDHFRYVQAVKETSIPCSTTFSEKESHADDIFIHDEVQYWNLHEMQDFLGTLRRCTRVIYSIVYPAEVDVGFEASIFPEAYDFRISGEGFIWMPDGNSEGSYWQPKNSWLLSTSKTIDSEGRTWTITKLNSIASHHLFACTLGSTINESEYEYADSTVIHPMFNLRGLRDYRDMRLRTRYIRPVLLYLLALRKPDPESAVAKLRMLSHKNESMHEALFVAQLAKQIRDTSLYDRMGNFNLKSAVGNSFKEWLGPNATYFLDRSGYHANSLESFIKNCDNVRFSISRTYRERVIKVHPIILSDLEWGSEGTWDMVYLSNLISMDREHTPYVLNASEVIGRVTSFPLGRILRAWELIADMCQRNEVNYNRVVYVFDQEDLINLKSYLIKVNTYEYVTSRAIKYDWKPQDVKQGYLSSGAYLNFLKPTQSERATVVSGDEQEDEEEKCACGLCLTSKTLSAALTNDLVVQLEAIPLFNELNKNRLSAFFSRHSAEYAYRGGSHQSRGWLDVLDKLRSALGLGDDFDHCLVQRYERGSGIGFHADDEECYLPGMKVVTVNVGGQCTFSVKCKDNSIKDFKLDGPSVLVMGAGAQVDHKHRVQDCSDGRLSITLRNKTKDYIDDASGSEYEEERLDGEDLFARLDKDKSFLCSIQCIAEHMRVDVPTCTALIAGKDTQVLNEISKGGVTLATMINLCKSLDIETTITGEGSVYIAGSFRPLFLSLEKGHLVRVNEGYSDRSSVSALKLNKNITKCSFTTDAAKARVLAESYKEGYTGILLNRFKSGKCFKGDWDEKEVSVWLSTGFAGSGKSHYIQSVLKNCEVERTLIITPRKNLAADWAKKVSKKHKVVTLEKALLNDYTDFRSIVIDEIGLFPPGYLDLLVYATRCTNYVVLGDPLQCAYYSKEDSIILEKNNENIYKRFHGMKVYLMYSHRLKPNKLFDIECSGEGISGQEDPSKRPVIVASRAEKLKQPNGYTVSETQGLTFKDSVVKLDRDWVRKGDGDVVVAFSRHRGDCEIVASKSDKEYLIKNSESLMLKKILVNETISRLDLCERVKQEMDEVNFSFSEDRLANSEEFEERLSGDPYLKALLNILEEIQEEEIEMPEPEAPEPLRTHLPLSEKLNELEPTNLKAKEDREVLTSFGLTDQIDDQGFKSSPGPQTHKALYLHHDSQDDATFMLSVKKRLRFRDMETNMRKFKECEGVGPQLFHELKKTYNWTRVEQLPALDKCDADFLKKRIQKSAKLIERHSYRSSPDWPSNYLKVFLKNQTCTKLEKRGVDAKAGQTIACFCHSVLCRFGTKLRQTEKALKNMLPANVMIYSQKNYSDLDKWCKTFVNSFTGTDSDYEAFDRSQDEKILRLEVEVLKFFLWEEELINEYVTLKLMMGCSLGNLAIMRFSGEFGTFFFNTVANMAFSCMRYNLSYNTPICFAGDDMYSPGQLNVRHDYDKFLDTLELKAKVNFGDKPLFCGWRMSPYGIVKEPNLILDRWKIAEGKGNLKDCLVNYALEAVYGYRLSEFLYELNIDIDAQQELTRKIVKVKDQLPEKISRLFSRDATEHWSDGESEVLQCTPEGELI